MLRALFAGLLLISALISEGSLYFSGNLLGYYNTSDGKSFAILENDEYCGNDIYVNNEVKKVVLPAEDLKYVLQAAFHNYVFAKNGIELAKINYAGNAHFKKHLAYVLVHSTDKNITQSNIQDNACKVGYLTSIYDDNIGFIIDSEITFSRSDISPPGIKVGFSFAKHLL
mgnify:CR=1 FL=1